MILLLFKINCKLFDRTVSLLIFQTGPFSIDTGILSTFNQQLWLLCQIKLNGTKAGNIMYYEEQWLPVDFTISKTSYHHLKFQQNTNLFQILEANFSDYSIFTSIHFNCFHVVKCNLLCQRGNTWTISTQISLRWTNKVISSVGKSTFITGGICHL